MEEQQVREQLEEALDSALSAIREEHGEDTDDLPDAVRSFEEAGVMTSDEGVEVSYPDGSAFCIHIVCRRRATDQESLP